MPSASEAQPNETPTQTPEPQQVTLMDVCPPSGGVLTKAACKVQTPRKGRHLWRKGECGNPAGRPPGASNSFTAQFRHDVAEAYRTKGGIAWLRRLKPAMFAKILMHVVPRQVQVDKRVTNRLELAGDVAPMLAARVDALIAQLAPSLPLQEPAIDVESHLALPGPAPEPPDTQPDSPPLVVL